MKKYLLATALILTSSIAVSAKGFEPQVRITGDVGVDSYKNNSFGADFVAAYRFSDLFRIGGGLGISYIDLLYESAHYNGNHWYKEYRESAVSIPVFFDGKLNFTKTKVSPYFNLDLGYAIYIPCSDYAKDNTLGFFVQPAFGVDFRLGNGALFLQAGYKYQLRNCDHWTDPNGNYSQVSFAVGYQF